MGPQLDLVPLWTNRLASGPDSAILAVAARDTSQAVNSHAKVGPRELFCLQGTCSDEIVAFVRKVDYLCKL